MHDQQTERRIVTWNYAMKLKNYPVSLTPSEAQRNPAA